MDISLIRRAAALTAVGALLALIVSTTALAGETRTWDDARYTAKGYAKASVIVDFPSKRAFDVQGYVEDRCPKDGFGAYLKTTYAVTSATGYSSPRTGTTFKDSNGCGNGTSPFDPGPLVVPKGYRLNWVNFQLCYEDKNGDGSGAVVLNACVSQRFDNWRLQ